MQKPWERQTALEDPEKLQHRVRSAEQELEEALMELDELRRRESHYRKLLDQLPLGIVSLDEAGKVFTVNRTFCELCGQNPKDLSRGKGLTWRGSLNNPALRRAVEGMIEQGLDFQIDEAPSAACAGGEHCLSFQGRTLGEGMGAGSEHLILVEDLAGRDEAGERLKSSLAFLRSIVLGAVDAMSIMVERRDPFVAGHQKRSAELAAAIAVELGMDAFATEGIRIAALLHDIGKVAIPSEILCKPAPLHPAEQKIVRTHPIVAQRILKRIPFPWPVAETILQHMERLDGSGYPHGIRGDEILIQARILAVADTVEAMLTYRPYRPAHSLDAVMDQIRENRGRLYDPQVADACVRLFREKGFTFKQG